MILFEISLGIIRLESTKQYENLYHTSIKTEKNQLSMPKTQEANKFIMTTQ